MLRSEYEIRKMASSIQSTLETTKIDVNIDPATKRKLELKLNALRWALNEEEWKE